MIRVRLQGASSPIEIPKLNNLNTTPATLTTLFFREDKPVRTVTFEPGGVPYFFLDDICEAAGWHAFSSGRVDSNYFPSFGKRTAEGVGEDGAPFAATVLSPTGVFYFTDLVDPGKGQRVAAWAKREARALCPDHPKNDPAMFLTLVWNDRLPPRPYKFSGYRSEWCALKDAHTRAVITGRGIEALRCGDENDWATRWKTEEDAAWDKVIATLSAAKAGVN